MGKASQFTFNCHLVGKEAELRPNPAPTQPAIPSKGRCDVELGTLGQASPARGDAGPGALLLCPLLPSTQIPIQPSPAKDPAAQCPTCRSNARPTELDSQEILKAPVGGRAEELWYHSRLGNELHPALVPRQALLPAGEAPSPCKALSPAELCYSLLALAQRGPCAALVQVSSCSPGEAAQTLLLLGQKSTRQPCPW